MALDSYTNLKTAIALWLNRNDLTDAIPDFVKLAEADLNRRLRSRENESRDTAFAVTTRFTALPADFAQLRRLVYLGNTRREIQPIGSVVGSVWDSVASGQLPTYYGIHGNELEIVPALAGTFELTYWRKVLPLASNETTSVLTAYPDVYLYGSCLAAGYFLDDANMAARFKPLYEQVLAEANASNAALLGGGLMVRAS